MCKKHPHVREVCATEIGPDGYEQEVYPPRMECPACVEEEIAEAYRMLESIEE